ncbi:MAG: 3-hydroxybutyryl-CoA dehydrogenase, partial [Rhodospirillaceae bacterium]|nr:3-hydroxybutyryl-CoA dehydrogenase [Rhodospirillaceae bacterium]
MNIKTVGVVGAGQMGNGIAHVFAVAGFDVRLVDVDPQQIERALELIDTNIGRQVRRGTVSEAQKAQALARILAGTDYALLADCDLVIEAATENEQVKREILKAVCPLLKAEAIIASNTSSISITRLAAATDRPARFMGMHFMNPVPVMQLVELIRGLATDDATFNTIKELTERLGKTAAVAEDFPAFIVNRILLPMINEAIYTLYEGVGSVEAIDTAMR